ncbi:MAG: 2Fe-2S iron-sulfur cluster binding domain-containing protein, partial [Rhodobacteraceae bacterium]|nr:2Fe-2S iron-sulfur cluster binding domain-containing protein [Paracoccaceae bacterium]
MADEVAVVFTPSGRRGRVERGTTVLAAARALGVDLDSVCGGRGICSRCQVTPMFGEFAKHGLTVTAGALSPWNAVEERYRSKRGLLPGRRLGCQARLMGDCLIDVPPESQLHRQVIRKAADARPVETDPATRPLYVEVAEPDMQAPSGDFERLAAALARDWGVARPVAGPAVLAGLQRALRAGDWAVTVALHDDGRGGPPEILGLWPGYREGELWGVAIDVGSTTIAAHLVSLQDGRVA